MATRLVALARCPPDRAEHSRGAERGRAACRRRVGRITAGGGRAMSRLFDAVLFDRDGTLIVDVPYNGDPAKVVVMPGARAALDRLRAAGLRIGVVTNQSGLAR